MNPHFYNILNTVGESDKEKFLKREIFKILNFFTLFKLHLIKEKDLLAKKKKQKEKEKRLCEIKSCKGKQTRTKRSRTDLEEKRKR